VSGVGVLFFNVLVLFWGKTRRPPCFFQELPFICFGLFVVFYKNQKIRTSTRTKTVILTDFSGRASGLAAAFFSVHMIL
jgi:hypothetical protein